MRNPHKLQVANGLFALFRGVPPMPEADPLPDLLALWRRVRDSLADLRDLRPDLFAGRAGA